MAPQALQREQAESLETLGFEYEDQDQVEIFHERTKISPQTSFRFRRRIVDYLFSNRGRLETSRNFKEYPFSRGISLPEPKPHTRPLCDVLRHRVSSRGFKHKFISALDLSSILSVLRVNRTVSLAADQDLKCGFRAYSSGGGLYPVETYVVPLSVDDIAPSVYYYCPRSHCLKDVAALDRSLFTSSLGDVSEDIADIAVVIFTTVVSSRSTVKYGMRGYRFSLLENGAVSLLIEMSCASLGLVSYRNGSYYDDAVNSVLDVDGVVESVCDCVLIGSKLM